MRYEWRSSKQDQDKINESAGWNGWRHPGETSGFAWVTWRWPVITAESHPGLKGLIRIVTTRSLRVQPHANMGSGLVD